MVKIFKQVRLFFFFSFFNLWHDDYSTEELCTKDSLTVIRGPYQILLPNAICLFEKNVCRIVLLEMGLNIKN